MKSFTEVEMNNGEEETGGVPRIVSISELLFSSKSSGAPPPSPPKTEEDYFSGIVPGILYAADAGGIMRYVPRSCHTGGPCRVSCRLYGERGECKYEESLKGTHPGGYGRKDDSHRFITNVLEASSQIIPKVNETEKSVLVVDALEKGEVASQVIPPLPNIESEVDAEMKKLESLCDRK